MLALPGRRHVGLGIFPKARNSANTKASKRSVFLVDSAITRSFLGWASTTFSASGSISSANQR